MNNSKSRDVFKSKLGMIMATVGFAVGVGNLWRFPFVTGQNGGGVFLLFYFVLLALIGIPLLVAEISLGVKSKSTPVGAYKSITPDKKWHLTGYVHMLAMVLISGYTIPIGGWILHYFFKTATGQFTGMDPGQLAEYFGTFTGSGTQVLMYTFITLALILVIVPRGLQKGIEKASSILIPSLFVMMVLITIKGLSLPNALEGIKFYLKPNFANFTMGAVSAALSQMFYSVGIGMAAALVFGSYIPKGEEHDIGKTGVQIAMADTLVAVLAGFMIFPIVSSFGLETDGGPGLVFITMPNIFNSMTGGILWGSIFYACFFVAAFTSYLSGAETIIGFLQDQYYFARKKAIVVYIGITLVIAVPCAYSMDIFGKIDFFENGIVLPLAAFLMSIYVGWIWGMDQFFQVSGIRSPLLRRYFSFSIKYLSPIVIVFLAMISLGLLKL